MEGDLKKTFVKLYVLNFGLEKKDKHARGCG